MTIDHPYRKLLLQRAPAGAVGWKYDRKKGWWL